MDFRQAEEQFRNLEQALRAGQIAQDEYRERLAKLVVIDAQGRREVSVIEAGLEKNGAYPLWKMTGQATYDIHLTSVIWAAVMDESTEGTVVCTGTVTYQVSTYVYKDVKVVVDDSSE